MSRMTCRNGFIFVAAMCFGLVVTSTSGGSLDSPAAPTDPASAMFTSQDVYNRLDTGAVGAKRTGAFTEPSVGPITGAMYSFDQIMVKAPATNANAVTDAEVLSGKVYWGLKAGAWGQRSGAMATRTLSAASAEVQAGYYVATNLVQVDTNLAAGNIATNVTIFGITGTHAGGISVPKTGQTTSYQTGDDGTYQNGAAWPNPRFTVQANTNCVLDNLTGLMWARKANLYANTWSNAIVYCEGLTYGGYSDWRLPNIEELHSIIAWKYFFPALCNTAGTGQWVENDPFTGVQSFKYWSGTTYVDNTAYAWYVNLSDGTVVIDNDKTIACWVWPVRGGGN